LRLRGQVIVIQDGSHLVHRSTDAGGREVVSNFGVQFQQLLATGFVVNAQHGFHQSLEPLAPFIIIGENFLVQLRQGAFGRPRHATAGSALALVNPPARQQS
jgi:predicted RNA binding protein YcfA (HicA-like mRNA interferase family)